MSAGDKTARAEAAAWLARLRSEDRTPEDERGFRAWLAESEQHRAAFEVTNAIFEMAGAADRRPQQAVRVSRRHLLRTGVGLAAASMAGLVVYLRSGRHARQPGHRYGNPRFHERHASSGEAPQRASAL
jgi:transmembrane sensor